jgi:hypothetical protein
MLSRQSKSLPAYHLLMHHKTSRFRQKNLGFRGSTSCYANYHTTTQRQAIIVNEILNKKLNITRLLGIEKADWRSRSRGTSRSAHLLLICGATGVTQDIPLEVYRLTDFLSLYWRKAECCVLLFNTIFFSQPLQNLMGMEMCFFHSHFYGY